LFQSFLSVFVRYDDKCAMFGIKMFTRSFQFAIIVSERALSRLKLFCSAFTAQSGRLIGMETGQEV